MSASPLPNTIWRNPIMLLACGFGSGAAPKAPGTFGTLIAIPLFYVMADLSPLVYAAIVLGMFLIGIYLCDYTAKKLRVHDHPGIVWDEIVGYLITMFMFPNSWLWMLLGFGLFRLFDIWKPWPIRLLDRHVQGGFGIMIDDVLAGIYALGCLYALKLII